MFAEQKVFERKVVVGVRDGLHARPATQFCKLARGFASSIEIERAGQKADAKSSVKLMLLGVQERDEITLRIKGEDATAALDCLAAFMTDANAGLVNDSEIVPAQAPKLIPHNAEVAAITLLPRGIGASDGVSLGAAFPFFHAELPVPGPCREPLSAIVEQELHQAALTLTQERLAARRDARRAAADREGEAIIEALIELVVDPAFTDGIISRIQAGADAVTATLQAGEEVARAFANVEDPYIRARAEDMRSVTRAIALALLGREEPSLADAPAGAIILADDLGALELSTADLRQIGGLICRQGTPLSHVAILARTYGVPAVVGYAAPIASLMQARTAALDGATGEVWLDPDAAISAQLNARISLHAAERIALEAYRTAEPITRDGRRIQIAANIGGLKDIHAAQEAGAEGIGLFRTEFLFMERANPPDEDEQFAVYTEVLRAFHPHPVVVRTLDIGGDKPVAGITFPPEANPFLGWRGVRMCLDTPSLFKPQLRALLRAAPHGRLQVMLPMVSDIREIAAVRALIAECTAELVTEGHKHGAFELGIMIETPAAVLMAGDLARHVSFFSIGTNDLTQYIMAADRLNGRVAGLNQADHPAVLRAIAMVCTEARFAGIPVGMCGEAAARPDLIPLFVEMGVAELSMSPAAVLRAKKAVTAI